VYTLMLYNMKPTQFVAITATPESEEAYVAYELCRGNGFTGEAGKARSIRET
jgi:hypothetical protein